jgi:hypothetical protein
MFGLHSKLMLLKSKQLILDVGHVTTSQLWRLSQRSSFSMCEWTRAMKVWLRRIYGLCPAVLKT